jgi:hypothetical protein
MVSNGAKKMLPPVEPDINDASKNIAFDTRIEVV